MVIPEVAVLGHHHTVVPISRLGSDESVVRLPSVSKLGNVQGIMTGRDEQGGKARWQLRVDEEPHAAPRGTTR